MKRDPPKKFWPQVLKFSRSLCFRCLQVLKISCLLLRLLLSLLYKMWNFSFRQRRHFLVIGLKLGALSIKSHLRVKSIFLSFSSQTWALRLVLCLSFSFLMSLLCLYHLSLNLLPVSPVYVSVLPLTVSVTEALYTTLSVRHLPCTGQEVGPCLQLQLALACTGTAGCAGGSDRILTLCLDTALAMFGIHL